MKQTIRIKYFTPILMASPIGLTFALLKMFL